MEPSRPLALLLLAAVLSDTVILNSPTSTERDRDVVSYFERTLGLDAREFGREMFESTADITGVPAEDLVTRDAKHYEAGDGRTLCIAQIETVGVSVLDRAQELREAMCAIRERRGYVTFALLITDILAKGSSLIVCGEDARIEHALGQPGGNGVIDLPGVMSRKKQLAPRLLPLF
jgi:manganese-dependent inorganic pyrophosphatase